MAKLKLMRCGWCGVFCDNEGRIFEYTKQIIIADKIVGFEDLKTTCTNCTHLTIKESLGNVRNIKTI